MFNEMKAVVWDGVRFAPKLDLNGWLPLWLTYPKEDVATLPYQVAAAGTPSPLVSFQMQEQGSKTPFIGKYSVFEDSTDGTALANFTCKLTDSATNRDLMNRPIHIRNMAGVGQTPFIFCEPLVIEPNGVIKAQYAKISGGATNIRHYLVGKYWFGAMEINAALKEKIEVRRRYTLPYWLTSEDTVITLAGNGTTTFSVKIGSGHFQAQSFMAVATGNFSVTILEVNTRRTLMNGAISQTNGIGTANFPFIFDKEYLIPHGAELRITLTDLSGSSNTIYPALHGRSLFVPFKDVNEMLKDTAINMD